MQIWNKGVFFSLKYNPNGEICEPSILSFLPLELHLNDSFVFLICLQNIHTQKIRSSRKKKKKLKNTNNRISLGFFFFLQITSFEFGAEPLLATEQWPRWLPSYSVNLILLHWSRKTASSQKQKRTSTEKITRFQQNEFADSL